jgi:hypothetical protein
MRPLFLFAKAKLLGNSKKITAQSFLRKIISLLFLVISSASFCQQDSILFIGDFNNGIVAGVAHPNTWGKYAPEFPKPDDHRWKLDSTIVRQGRYSLRVELRPGDTSRNGVSDRAEVIGMQGPTGDQVVINGKSGTAYLAFSIQLDSLWQPPRLYDTLDFHAAVLQLHKTVGGMEDVTTGPAFALQVLDKFIVRTNTGSIYNSVRTDYYLSDESLKKGKWIDFVIRIKFAVRKTGEITIWRRNEGKARFSLVLDVPNVSTLLYDTIGSVHTAVEHTLHTGYYRNRQKIGGVTNILWLDGYTLARTSAAAQFNAFDSAVVLLPGDSVISCVSPVPIATNNNISCDGAGSIALKTLGGPGPFTYVWQGPGGFTSVHKNIKVRRAGIYTVTVTSQGGCSDTASFTVENSCKEISVGQSLNRITGSKSEITNSGLTIQVFPNAAATQFNLIMKSSSNEKAEINVVDMYGKKVYHAAGSVNNTYTFGKEFSPGAYFVNVIQGKEIQTLKLIKEQ